MKNNVANNMDLYWKDSLNSDIRKEKIENKLIEKDTLFRWRRADKGFH